MWQFENVKDPNINDQFQEDRDKLFAEIEEKKKEIIEIVDSYQDTDISGDLKDVIKNGFQLYVNGHVVDMKVTDVKELPADKLKEDVKTEFQNKLNQIKESINEKLYSLSESYESLREKLDDEIEKAKMDSQKVEMPDITYWHAINGLFVVKGENNNDLSWFFRSVYKVKTVDEYPISKKMSKKTMQNVVVQIDTKDDKVVSVKLKNDDKKFTGFDHYHATDDGTSDCWGDWNYNVKWESPDDIMDVGKYALKILEDVNTDSPGNNEPPELPSLDTLIRSKNTLKARKQINEDNENEDEDEDEDDFFNEVDDEPEDHNDNRNYIWTT